MAFPMVLRQPVMVVLKTVNHFHSREIVLACPVSGVLVGGW